MIQLRFWECPERLFRGAGGCVNFAWSARFGWNYMCDFMCMDFCVCYADFVSVLFCFVSLFIRDEYVSMEAGV